jgi:mannose-1-phosphate guanylyltransferase
MKYTASFESAIADPCWTIVLGGGSGTRLSSLTNDTTGNAVPKQFCSIDGTRSLIEQTLTRAATESAPHLITAVVTASHRQYWEPALERLPSDNIVIQPQNRGTAIGILLPALRIAARNPQARILILPSDHYVANEPVLKYAMHTALEDIRTHESGVALLGIEADEPDPDLGYILPRFGSHPRLHHVHRFIEKPSIEVARRLVGEGALWNSFIIVCRVESLIRLLINARPTLVDALQAINSNSEISLAHLYRSLPAVDFSRDIVTGQEHRMLVAAVGACGWNDLGTPIRLAKTVAAMNGTLRSKTIDRERPQSGWINLADRLAQIHPALLGIV